jgi:hypothetical protein
MLVNSPFVGVTAAWLSKAGHTTKYHCAEQLTEGKSLRETAFSRTAPSTFQVKQRKQGRCKYRSHSLPAGYVPKPRDSKAKQVETYSTE